MLDLTQKQIDLLKTQERGFDERHRSLRAAIGVSCSLLTPELKQSAAYLSQFRSWSLEVTEAVCATSMASSIESLLAASMIFIDEPAEPMRYRMYESVREFCGEILACSSEAEAAAKRFALYFLTYAQAHRKNYQGEKQKVAFDAIEREHANLLAALEWFCERREYAESALALAAALWFFWLRRGYERRGYSYLKDLLSSAEGISPQVRADALNGGAALAQGQKEYDTAQAWLEESVRLYEMTDNTRGATNAKGNLGMLAFNRADYYEAQKCFEECLALYMRLHDVEGMRHCYNNLGIASLRLKDHAASTKWFEIGLRASREAEDPLSIAMTMVNWIILHLRFNEFDEAKMKLQETLVVSRGLRDNRLFADALDAAGELAALQEQGERAATLFGATDTLRREMSLFISEADNEELQANRARAQKVAGSAAYSAAWERGKRMNIEDAIEYALQTR